MLFMLIHYLFYTLNTRYPYSKCLNLDHTSNRGDLSHVYYFYSFPCASGNVAEGSVCHGQHRDAESRKGEDGSVQGRRERGARQNGRGCFICLKWDWGRRVTGALFLHRDWELKKQQGQEEKTQWQNETWLTCWWHAISEWKQLRYNRMQTVERIRVVKLAQISRQTAVLLTPNLSGSSFYNRERENDQHVQVTFFLGDFLKYFCLKSGQKSKSPPLFSICVSHVLTMCF